MSAELTKFTWPTLGAAFQPAFPIFYLPQHLRRLHSEILLQRKCPRDICRRHNARDGMDHEGLRT